MNFESHQAIWFFWLLPVMLVAFLFFEKRRLGVLYSFLPKALVPKRLPEYAPLSSWWRCILFLAALGCLGMALMKPYSDFEIREVKKRGVDLYFLVDLSRSMESQDVKPSRIDRARREIVDFIKRMKGDRVGLIGFAGSSFVFVPLTSDYNAIDLFIEELSPDAIPVPGTDIKGAISKAVQSFKKQQQNSGKAVILITDGEDSIGLDQGTIDAILKQNIKVFVIGIGTLEGGPIPLAGGGYKTDKEGKVVITKLNETALQTLAVATGGGYVRSVTGDLDLEQIYFQGIKKSIEEAELGSKQKKVPQYDFQKFLLIAFILLCLEILTTNRKWYWLKSVFRFKGRSKTIAGMVLVFCLLASPVFAIPNPLEWEKADKSFQNEDYEEALAQYLELIQKHPETNELYYNLANTYYRLGKFKEAQKSFKKALNSKNPTIRKLALFYLGNVSYRLKKLEESLEHYQNTLKMDPEFRPAELNYEFVKKQMEQEKQDQDQQDQDQQDQDQQDQDQQNQDQQNQDQQNQDQQNQDQQNQDQQNQDQQNQDQQNQDQQDQDQQNQDQQDQDQQDQDQQDQDQQDQDQQDQDQQDQDQQDQGDQEKDQQDQKDQGDQEKDQQDQKDQGDQEKDQQEQKDQGDQEKDQQDQKDEPQGSENQDGAAGGDQSDEEQDGKGAAPGQFQFDENAEKWLESISDEPGKVLKYMIQQQTQPPTEPIEKDW